jgi:hypothetical protein
LLNPLNSEVLNKLPTTYLPTNAKFWLNTCIAVVDNVQQKK